MANSSQFPMALVPHLNKMFVGRYKEIPSQIGDHYSSGKTDEYYEVGASVTGLGLVPETREGMRPEYEDPLNGFPYVHHVLSYRMGIRITDKLYKSDRYKIFGPKMVGELAKSARYTQEILAARPFNYGFTTFLSPDGSSFFNAAHPLVGGGTGSNRPSTGAALSVSALQAGATAMRRQTDDKGKLLTLRPKDLVIPPDLEFAAKTILSSTLLPGSANNDINTLSGAFNPIIWDFLTSTTAWWLRAQMSDVAETVVLKMKTPVKTSPYYDWHTRSTLYDVEFEQLIGATDWRGYYGSPGA